jgi:hypothetical protein
MNDAFALFPHRILKQELVYTSLPIPPALSLTPEEYRSDETINALRAADAAGECSAEINTCQIPFLPKEGLFDRPSPVGVILYCGAFVDPRAYSPLASTLAQEYGLTVVIPVFDHDIAFTADTCNSGRLDLAKAEFPHVKKWIFVGHSLGGVGAITDVWTESDEGTNFEDIAGLVMLASYYLETAGCGEIDLSSTTLPAAAITASFDGYINLTTWEENQFRFPKKLTIFLNIEGGNHGQFGCYDDEKRYSLFGKKDGEATISPQEQWDLTTSAIYEVAQRSGLALPERIDPIISPTVELMWHLLRFQLYN